MEETYLVSARKYRPMTFESVVGQKALTDTLRNAIRQNKLAHAYLFCGPRGVGKTTCARILAKTINCENLSEAIDPCNRCESCVAFNEQRSFNIHELDAASNNSVDDIRDLIAQVQVPPQVGRYSVYIIDEVHMLSQGAFNALLKTLEEPPKHAIFILATTEKHKVLPTILSRCQVFDFQRIRVEDMVAYLRYVSEQEGVTAPEEVLNVIAQKADGGMRDALSLFDQVVAFSGKELTYEHTIEVLNVLDSDYYFRLGDCFLKGDVRQSLLIFDEILSKGFDAGNFMSGLAQHLRDVLVSHDESTLPLLECSAAVRTRYREQAGRMPAQWIFRALEEITRAEETFRLSRNRRLTVELMLMKVANLNNASQSAATTGAAIPTAAAVKSAPTAAPPPTTTTASAQVTAAPQTAAQPAASTQATGAQTAGLPKLPSLSGLKGLGQQPTAQAAPTESAPQPVQQQGAQTAPFTQDQLNSAWVGLKRSFPKETRLLAMIDRCRPVKQNEHEALVTFVNPWQEMDFKKFAPQILGMLRQALRNTAFVLHTAVSEVVETKVAYTADERYKVLLAQNPYLATFKERFEGMIE